MSTLDNNSSQIKDQVILSLINLMKVLINQVYLSQKNQDEVNNLLELQIQIDNLMKDPSISEKIKNEYNKMKVSLEDPNNPTLNNPILESKLMEKELDLSHFPAVNLKYHVYPEYDSKSKVILEGSFDITFYITQVQSSFLDFLIQEKLNKVENEKPWLSEIKKRVNYIKDIINRYELPSNYDEELEELDGSYGGTTWVNDNNNYYRKTIVSEINNKLKFKYNNVKGKLIALKKIKNKIGIYTLEKHLKEASVEKSN